MHYYLLYLCTRNQEIKSFTNLKMYISMKRRILFVENFAKVENVIIRDLSNEYGLDGRAARIMQ